MLLAEAFALFRRLGVNVEMMISGTSASAISHSRSGTMPIATRRVLN